MELLTIMDATVEKHGFNTQITLYSEWHEAV